MADLAVVAVIRVVTREAAAGEAAVLPEAALPAGVLEVPRAAVNKAEQSRVARSSCILARSCQPWKAALLSSC
jgi:hypothetical protein